MHGGGDQPGRALSRPRREGNTAQPSVAPLQGLGGADAGVWRGLEGHMACGGHVCVCVCVEIEGSWEGTLILGDGEGRDGERMGGRGL